MKKLFFIYIILSITLISSARSVFEEPVILALGDSLTAGHGVSEEDNYPSRLQVILRRKGYPHKVVNAGVGGDTSARGLSRLDFLMRHKPKIVILALGANDGYRGMSVDKMQSNLEKIIQRCQKSQAKVLLAGIRIFPKDGKDYMEAFHEVYNRLANKYNLPLIPFLLEGVAGKREYTQKDGLHPIAEGYKIVTQTVWKKLLPLLPAEPNT